MMLVKTKDGQMSLELWGATAHKKAEERGLSA
jgi:hypothetical protein